MTVQTSQAPEMTAATKSLLGKAQRLIPPMLEKFHKGQLGRVGVIGGSKDYTGAPYFSAMASARLGCDMSHVICTPEAGAVIKTYSPNLMVHPLMRQSDSKDGDATSAADGIIEMLSRLHALVIGPGLGRDPEMQATVRKVITAARERSIPLVIDADALLVVKDHPDLVKGYELAVLTPNVVEFKRLWDSFDLGDQSEAKSETDAVEKLAKAYGGVTVVQKGTSDFISNGTTTLADDLRGGLKRSGGQGDTLTGSLATFLAWRQAYHDSIWDIEGEKMDEKETIGLAAFASSAITRECSRLAFLKKGRSLQASDLTEEVHNAFMNLFGEVDADAGAKL